MMNYNHYNQNPPEPIVNLSDISPDEILEQAVEEHLYEQRINDPAGFVDIAEMQVIELIKNESDQTV